MIDIFALAITHALMLYIAVQLMMRDDLDREPDTDISAAEGAEEPASHA